MYGFWFRRWPFSCKHALQKRKGAAGLALAVSSENAGPRLLSSGSSQAREGRLVDALAVRGDEGRDTLR